MNNLQFEEGNLAFDFTGFSKAEKFDDDSKNAYGMLSVDFIAENSEHIYFIEVKDFRNPKATKERKAEDYKMLIGKDTEGNSIFAIKMGGKIKDSLLRKYAMGDKFTKEVVYLLLINLDNLSAHERGRLKEKIAGHVPTGLNKACFCEFSRISFDLVNIDRLKSYGVVCTVNTAI